MPPPSASAATSSSDPSPLLNAPRSSHVSAYSKNSSVTATHIIDLGRPVPPSVLREETHEGEVDEKGRRANGFWGSQNGGVKVLVGVDGGQIDKREGEERVRLSARSQNGAVRLTIVSWTSDCFARSPSHPYLTQTAIPSPFVTRLRLAKLTSSQLSCGQVERAFNTPTTVTVFSQNGSVHLILPSNFHGPLTLSTSNGKINLSPKVRASHTPLKDGLGFLGPLDGWDGTDEDAELKGLDVGRARSKNGSVNVKFYEEVVEEEKKSFWGGLWKK